MTQFLKGNVQDAILRAALEVFAREGFERASVAEVAKRAKVSTGNIYRYFASKEVLFHDAITEDFVRSFGELVKERVESARESEDPDQLMAGPFLDFCLENRLQVVILLGRAQGTRYARQAEQLTETLQRQLLARVRERNPKIRLTDADRFALEHVYRNLVGTLVDLLARFSEPAFIRESAASYSRYHRAGIQVLLAR
jgi:AcrR family transcriptional regulator